MRAFITGINGFAGSHLASLAIEAGWAVQGVSERPEYRGMLPAEAPVFLADVRDRSSLETYLAEFRPGVVFHLAGFASPGLSRLKPAECLSVNVLGTANILEAVVNAVPEALVIVVTTAHFHVPAADGRVDENSPMEARDPYTASKICAYHLCRYYYAERGLKIIEARPSNHFGPGQQTGYVIADFAGQIAGIAAGLADGPVRVGNLDVARDLLYVEDVARAYIALAEGGVPGEAYCVSSGRPAPIREILDTLIELSGCKIEIEIDPERVREGEQPVVSVSSEKIQHHTGWRPETSLRDGLARTLDYWLPAASGDAGS